MKSVVAFIFLISFNLASAKIFLNCEFAKELGKNEAIERVYIPHWVCLAQGESQLNTSKLVNYPNQSSSYGIFQINSKEQCGKDKKGGFCNIKCSDLLDDDIKDDIKCAKVIFDRSGFNNWKSWQNRCKSTSTIDKNKALPNLVNCQYK
ncbi:hypothetical protein PVAND_008478 [Polypedilum vanderplanki]|uniref:lysozyme n=1 Tax=Polypedilum vanderplanki TaxID=319348 RepID=A0A9J6CAC2_POLVA|nr:hypothetical protein PVAND_008478 [Polypedilum vanderplanki]